MINCYFFQVVAFQADPLKNVRPFITGSDFGSEIFYLSQFHFHWGYDVSLGSEHHIDNKTFPLEVFFKLVLIDRY